MLGLTFSSKLDWAFTLSPLLKQSPRKLKVHSMKFLSSEFALYLDKSTIYPCMEYCWHVWAVIQTTKMNMKDCWSFTCYISWTPGSLLKYGQLVFSIGITLVDVRCSSELAQQVPLFFARRKSTRHSDRFCGFSVTISRCYEDVYVNSFFPCTATLWNFLPIESFPLTYNLNGF